MSLYSKLLEMSTKIKTEFQEQQIIRIKKGIYKGDIGKIIKINSISAKIIVVPRIDLRQIRSTMKRI